MKKVLALVLALLMAALMFGLTGCGGKTSTDVTTAAPDAPTEAAKLVILDEPFSSEQYGIGFKKGNTELRDAVQAGLYQIFAEGKVAELAEKYGIADMVCLDSANATTFDVEAATEEFKARKTFTVGFDAEYPPYGYMDDDGSYTGFDLELAEAVCAIYGWELVKQPIDWESKDTELDSGSIDVIWNGFTKTGREDQYTWTDAYVDNTIVIMTMSDSGIKSVDDLAGKIVVAQQGSSAQTALDDDTELVAKLGGYELVADYNTAVMNLKSGIVDAVAIDIGVAEYQMANQ